MRGIWLVFCQQYWEHVSRPGYLLFTFGLPLLAIAGPLIGGSLLALVLAPLLSSISDQRPIGIVDEATLLLNATEYQQLTQRGMLFNPAPYATDSEQIIFFRTPQEAAAALNTNYIHAYYHLPPDYWETGTVRLTYLEQRPNQLFTSKVHGWIEEQLSADIPESILERLERGPNIERLGLQDEPGFSIITIFEGIAVYMLIYFVRMIGAAFTANYMFDSIANEANDRTLEIMITTISPLQFVLGKICGILATGLTQLAIWGSVPLILLQGASMLMGYNFIGYILAWPHLGLLLSILIGAYVMDHLLAAALGLLKVSGGAGMQMFSIINLIGLFGLLYATYFIPRNPDTPFAIAVSLFPLTSPLVLLVRVVVSNVPSWQTVLGQLFLWGTNILLIVWLRYLLKANLVSQSPKRQIWAWLKKQLSPQKLKQRLILKK